MTLIYRVWLGDLELTAPPYAIDFGSDYGAPENDFGDPRASLLFDGELLGDSRATNREAVLPVTIEAPDMDTLAQAEAALVREAARTRNTLTADPGDGFGAVTVFDSFRAAVRPVRSDDLEKQFLRQYEVSVPCLPYARSATKTQVAVTPTPAGVVVDSIDSDTGWSSKQAPSLLAEDITVDTGAYYVQGTGSVKVGAVRLTTKDSASVTYTLAENFDTVTGLSVATSTGGVLSILMRFDWPIVPDPSYFLPGSGLVGLKYRAGGVLTEVEEFYASQVVAGTGPSGGRFVRYSWVVPAGLTITELQLSSRQFIVGGNQARPYVRYDAITLATGTSTAKSLLGTVRVQGSVRTPGAVVVEGSTSLGEVLVMTLPEESQPTGFDPLVRKYLTAGATSADAAAINGTKFAVSGAVIDAPLSQLTPGLYEVWLRAKTSGSITFGVTAQARIAGTNTGATQTSTGSAVNSATYTWVSLGRVYLPPVNLQNIDETALVRLTFSGVGDGDEVVLAPADAAVSVIDCGSSTVSATGSSSHLWIDSPSLANPNGGWWRGSTDGRVNARSAIPDAKALGRHILNPPRMRVLAVTPGATNPSVSLDYYPAWHSNAGKVT